MKPRTRITCVALVALSIASWALREGWTPALHAQTPSNGAAANPAATVKNSATHADFDKLFKELSNWGRWGKDDEMGATNLITPAKRKAALATVKEGFSVSMARKGETEPAIDNPRPIQRVMGGAGRGGNPGAPPPPPPDITSAGDSLTISYHGLAHTHMDAFCHRAYQGLMYNGMPMTLVDDKGCNKGSVYAWHDGIITRAVLMDIPRLKGVDYLEAGTPIYPEDLDAWVQKAHIKLEAGDAILIRTGRWALRDAKGPYNTNQLAGLYMTCAKWLHAHDAAILGSDGAEDVHPSRVENVTEPVHALVLASMGMPIFDNLDLEAVAKEAAKRNRWEFLVTAAPAAIPGATGSQLNPIATF